MKRLFLKLTVVFFTCMPLINAQSFSPNFSEWYYSLRAMSPDLGYCRMQCTKADIIIENKNCMELSIINVDHKEVITSTETKYILYENNKIYEYLNSKFYLLYDFSLTDNSVIKTSYYLQPYGIEIDLDIYVNSVKDTTINNQTLKSYEFTSQVRNNSEYKIFFEGHAIEIVGNIKEYFFPKDNTILDYLQPTNFRCFNNNSLQIYDKDFYGRCDLTYTHTSLNGNSLQPYEITITDNELIINGNFEKDIKLDVYDTLGRKRMSRNITAPRQPVNIDLLPSGAFVAKLTVDKKCFILKFLKSI